MLPYQLIKARGIFDHNRGVIDTGKCILVKDKKIISVGTNENLELHVAKAPLKTIDLSDHYIFPGLCNTHVHLTFSASYDPLKEYFEENESPWKRCYNHPRLRVWLGTPFVESSNSGEYY